MQCSEVRWRLRSFLGEATDTEQDQLIREHLSHCPSCVALLVSDRQVEAIPSACRAQCSDDFTKRVVSQIPEQTTSAILFRYLCGVFVASSFVAVAIFAFVREYLRVDRLPQLTPWESSLSVPAVAPWLSGLIENPIFHYAVLTLIAVILSVSLVIIVDRPRRKVIDHTQV